MEAVKGAVLSLLLDAYQRRDKVGLICFRGNSAQTLLPPTSSVDAAARRLEVMPAGGRTPLAAGLAEAHATLAHALVGLWRTGEAIAAARRAVALHGAVPAFAQVLTRLAERAR
jgi:hypothetical protein